MSWLTEDRTDFFHERMMPAEVVHKGRAAFPFREMCPAYAAIRVPEYQPFGRRGGERPINLPQQGIPD